MAGFFPHTGGAATGYSTLPMTTFSTILDDIVADVTAQNNTNGWSVHDDQRTGFTPLVLPSNVGGLNITGLGMVFTNTSMALSQASYGRFRRNWVTGVSGTQISPNQTDWFYCTAIASQTAATLNVNYTGTTTIAGTTGHNIYEKSGPYVVLKCTSAQKTFYVLIARPVSYGDSLRIQVYETWNPATHTGTNPSPQETMRAYEDGQGRSGSTPLKYVLFLLPDVFTIWVGGSPSEPGVILEDLYYAGNLSALRAGDTTCLLAACTNQDLSGVGVSASLTYSSAGRCGGATMFKNVTGTTWTDPRAVGSYNESCNYAVMARGLSYIWGIERTNLDDGAKFQFCEMDAYMAGGASSGFDRNEGKRGELRYIKAPIMNPSGLHLASLGPADDGNTYMLLRSAVPNAAGGLVTSYSGDVSYNNNPASGFACGGRSGTLGEIVVQSVYTVLSPRWFMMPINL